MIKHRRKRLTSYLLSYLLVIGLNFVLSIAYAGGGMTHMFLAQEMIDRLPDAELRTLLKNNLEAYLVGAYYPDSGYISGNHYGEDSHWNPFIFTFADYVKEAYPHPELSNPKLVAFLFGCAAHRFSDEIMHWTFYPIAAKKDLNSDDWEAFHTYGDLGIDLLVTVDKNQWSNHPMTWWIPIKDLLQVYHRMGKDEYTAKEIIWGNSIIYLAGYGERAIALPAYPILKAKIPWAAQHYYDWPEGGLLADENKSSEYLMTIWKRLKNSAPVMRSSVTPATIRAKNTVHADDTVMTQFAKQMLENKVVDIPQVANDDGSVELQSPVINSFVHFQEAIGHLVENVTK